MKRNNSKYASMFWNTLLDAMFFRSMYELVKESGYYDMHKEEAKQVWNTFVGWIQGLSKSDKFAWVERKNFLEAYEKSKEVLEQALVNRFGVVK